MHLDLTARVLIPLYNFLGTIMRVSLNGSLKVKNMGAFLPLDFEKSDQLYQKSRAGHATIPSRENVTMLSGHKVVCNCHFTLFIVATPSRH